MKKTHLLLKVFLIPIDFLVCFLSFFTAYFIRLNPSSFLSFLNLQKEGFIPPINEYIYFIFFISLLLVLVFALNGLYNTKQYKKNIQETHKILILIIIWLFLVSSYFFWSRSFFFSRFVLVSGATITFALVVLVRIVFDWVKSLKVLKRSFQKELILVGVSKLNDSILKRLEGDGEYVVVKTFTENNDKNIENIRRYINENKVYEIIQTDVGIDKEFDLQLLDYCQTNNIQYNFTPGIIEFHSTLIDIKLLSNTPIIILKQTPLDGLGKVLKRLFDIVFSLLALILLSPVFLFVSALIKLTSKGPVFVALERVRLRGVFNIYKFRSMVDNAHSMKKDLMEKNERKDGPLFKMKEDPRVTKVGKILRKTRIDEIPQFLNVLKGEMSIVGPRPHEPEEVVKYKKHHKKLLSIKPGITGMAQTSGASDLQFEDEVRLDTFYIENWSIWLDLKIILKTVVVVFVGKGAV